MESESGDHFGIAADVQDAETGLLPAGVLVRLPDGQLFFEEVPRLPTDVVGAFQDPTPPEGRHERLGSEILGPELNQMCATETRVLFEGRQQPVRVALVALRLHYGQFHEVGHASSQSVAQPANPVTYLIGEDQVVILGLKGPASGPGFVEEDFGQPI